MNKLLTYTLGVLFLFSIMFSLNQCGDVSDEVPTDSSDTDTPSDNTDIPSEEATVNYLFDANDKCLGQILEEYNDTSDRGIIYFIQSSKDYVAMINKNKKAYEVGLDGSHPEAVFTYGGDDEYHHVIVGNEVSNLKNRHGNHAGVFFRIHNDGDGYLNFYSGDSTQRSDTATNKKLYYDHNMDIDNNAYIPEDCHTTGCNITLTNPVQFNAHNNGHQRADTSTEGITGFPSFFSNGELQVVPEPLDYTCNPF